jgi:hypothetical protein
VTFESVSMRIRSESIPRRGALVLVLRRLLRAASPNHEVGAAPSGDTDGSRARDCPATPAPAFLFVLFGRVMAWWWQAVGRTDGRRGWRGVGGPFGRTGRDTSLLCLPCRRASCAPLDDVVRRQAAAGVGGRALAGVSNHLGIAPYLSRRSRILTLAGGFTCSYVQRLTYAQLRCCTLSFIRRELTEFQRQQTGLV